MKKIIDTMEQQLAVDYDCSLEKIRSHDNVFRLLKNNEGSRPVCDEDAAIKIAVYNEKLLIMANEEMLEWCEAEVSKMSAQWLAEPCNLFKISNKLKALGQDIADIHHYYLPDGRISSIETPYQLNIYREKEILQFRDDNRFSEAILFEEDTPDMVAITAEENGTILGMAGATADTKNLWQVGVNVTDEGKGKGIGTLLISALKNEVLSMGKIPFYTTVESHIKSQRVAIKSGFIPTFYELFSAKR